MKLNIVGISNIDFTSKDGEQIKGTNLFVSFEDNRVLGLKTEKIFIRDDITLPPNIQPGSVVQADFNNRGKLVGISVSKQG